MDDVADLNDAWAIAPPAHVSLSRIAIGLKVAEPPSTSTEGEASRPSTKEEIDAFMAEVNRRPGG